jgi:4-oxalocrotonate tautomerase
MLQGRPQEVKRKLVKDITDIVVNDLSVPAESVTVVLEEYPREHWAVSGVLYSDKPES